ncbi:MAG TPA: Holliday junction branch migration protein RuvA [Candidatus Paceibacterota bacterium]
MIYFLEGEIIKKGEQFAVVKTGGVGFKVFLSVSGMRKIDAVGERVALFCHFHLREDAASLYGFLLEEELALFESLIAVSGIGPKSALGVLAMASTDKLRAAINGGHTELLTKVSGIGRKTAERIILELRGKVGEGTGGESIEKMEHDVDIEDALANLGYPKNHIREILKKIDPKLESVEERLRAALKLLKK